MPDGYEMRVRDLDPLAGAPRAVSKSIRGYGNEQPNETRGDQRVDVPGTEGTYNGLFGRNGTYKTIKTWFCRF
jgi:hypothetical protein